MGGGLCVSNYLGIYTTVDCVILIVFLRRLQVLDWFVIKAAHESNFTKRTKFESLD